MTLGLVLTTYTSLPGTEIPQEARVEAVLISLRQCECRGAAGVVLGASNVKALRTRLYQNDPAGYAALRASIDAELRALPPYPIAAALEAVADACPALPGETSDWDL